MPKDTKGHGSNKGVSAAGSLRAALAAPAPKPSKKKVTASSFEAALRSAQKGKKK